VPRGFGSRRRLLRELLLAASRYGRLDDVVGALSALVHGHCERLRRDWSRRAVAHWLERLVRTDTLLREVGARAAAPEAPSARA